MNLLKKVASGSLTASLLASLFAVSAGTAIAATASPVTTTVVPDGTPTTLPLATVTAAAPTDIPAGTLTLTLPAGYSWAATGTITTTETGGSLTVTDGTVTLGGTTATFVASGTAVAGSTIAFSSPTVKTTTSGASGNALLSGLSSPGSVIVARLRALHGSYGVHRDNDRGMGNGARKVGFFLAPAYACDTGAQPSAGASTYGFAILNRIGRGKHTAGYGKLNVNVVLKGALPSATYDVWINQDPGACPLGSATKVGAVTTNANGNGAGHLKVAIVSGAQRFWVSATSGASVLRTRAAVLNVKHH